MFCVLASLSSGPELAASERLDSGGGHNHHHSSDSAVRFDKDTGYTERLHSMERFDPTNGHHPVPDLDILLCICAPQAIRHDIVIEPTSYALGRGCHQFLIKRLRESCDEHVVAFAVTTAERAWGKQSPVIGGDTGTVRDF